MAKLVRREASPHAGLGREPMELEPHRGARPRPTASGAVDDTEQRADAQIGAGGQPRAKLLPGPGVHADLTATTALAMTHKQGATALVEI